jgi:hypothetical protein
MIDSPAFLFGGALVCDYRRRLRPSGPEARRPPPESAPYVLRHQLSLPEALRPP